MNRIFWVIVWLTSVGLLVAIFSEIVKFKQLEKPIESDVLSPQPDSRVAPVFNAANRKKTLVDLKKFRGKFVLLNFWATWCKPCKEELPHLAILATELSKLPVQLILVSVDESWTEIDKLADQLELAGPKMPQPIVWKNAVRLLRDQVSNTLNLVDPSAQAPKSYGTLKYPETYLIDPNGRLRYRFIGPKNWSDPTAIGFIKKALKP